MKPFHFLSFLSILFIISCSYNNKNNSEIQLMSIVENNRILSSIKIDPLPVDQKDPLVNAQNIYDWLEQNLFIANQHNILSSNDFISNKNMYNPKNILFGNWLQKENTEQVIKHKNIFISILNKKNIECYYGYSGVININDFYPGFIYNGKLYKQYNTMSDINDNSLYGGRSQYQCEYIDSQFKIVFSEDTIFSGYNGYSIYIESNKDILPIQNSIFYQIIDKFLQKTNILDSFDMLTNKDILNIDLLINQNFTIVNQDLNKSNYDNFLCLKVDPKLSNKDYKTFIMGDVISIDEINTKSCNYYNMYNNDNNHNIIMMHQKLPNNKNIFYIFGGYFRDASYF